MTVAFATLGCKLNQYDTTRGPGSSRGRGLPHGAVRDTGAGLRDQHLHRDGSRRLLGPADHPPRGRAEPGSGGRGHGVLRADQSGRGRSDPRRGPGPRHPGPAGAARAPRPGPEARPPARPGERRVPGADAPGDPGPASRSRAHASIREGTGRLPAPLQLLHRPVRPGREPEPDGRGRGRPGRGARERRPPGGGPHRRGPRPLRLGPAARARRWPRWYGGCSTSADWPGFACRPCCPPTSPRS